MKAAPVIAECRIRGMTQTVVHTGQHYDYNMSQVFFDQLGLPVPDFNLDVGSGSHAEQTAQVMLRLESILRSRLPDWVVVYGDVNSTLAAALVSAKLPLPVAHVEAGLRSFDWSMPEEINRVITDRLSTLLFTPSKDADANLSNESIDAERIRLVGNVMIDTLVKCLPLTERVIGPTRPPRYALVTLHRPSNVDSDAVLERIVRTLIGISKRLPIIFPVHPRTRARIDRMVDLRDAAGLGMVEPMGYLEFLALERLATVVITDSGGIQEETTFLGIPCLTLRDNTERPITVDMGKNTLIGSDYPRLEAQVDEILGGRTVGRTVPPLWDGRAAQRIADVFENARKWA